MRQKKRIRIRTLHAQVHESRISKRTSTWLNDVRLGLIFLFVSRDFFNNEGTNKRRRKEGIFFPNQHRTRCHQYFCEARELSLQNYLKHKTRQILNTVVFTHIEFDNHSDKVVS